jgi:hypothetical protein
MSAELAQIGPVFAECVGEGVPRIDGAYDKVLWRLHDLRFPLRLLPPYAGASEAAFDRFAVFVRERYPDWTA